MTLPFQLRASARFSLINNRGRNTALAVAAVDVDHTFDVGTVAFLLANNGPDTVFVDFTASSADATVDGFPLASGASLPFLDVEEQQSIRLLSSGNSDVRIAEIKG